MKSSPSRRDPVDVGHLIELHKQLHVFIFIFKLSVISLINLLIKLGKRLKMDLLKTIMFGLLPSILTNLAFDNIRL